MFVNQTQTVISRANGNHYEQATIIYSPALNVETGVVDFFANNFTWGRSSGPGTNLFWVPSNFDDILKHRSARLSTQSVGAMALARLHKSSYYLREAQRHYGLALLSLAELWQQGVDLEKDAVLITVLFLGFFEVLASYSSSSRRGWTTHLGGIGMLLGMRDEEYFSTDLGARMLLQSRNQSILNALQTKTKVPEAFQRPIYRFKQPTSPDIMASHHAEMLLTRLAELQAQHRVLGPSPALYDDLNTLIKTLWRWSDELPSSWSFSVHVCDRGSPFWWATRCDVYSAPLISHVWNKIRSAQLVAFDLIYETSLCVSSSLESQSTAYSHMFRNGTFTPEMQNLVIDICATIPMFYRPSNATADPRSDIGSSRPVLGTTYWLLWPLEIVGSKRDAPVDLKTWIVNCLERIYQITGIVKAQIAADRVKHCRGANAAP